ncbi:unnamed protein product, partial [Rotaria sordida]
QLSSVDGVHSMSRILSILRSHVKLIISPLSGIFNILNTLRYIIDSRENFV